MGYDLDPSFWRKGYSFEAATTIVQYGYQIMKLHRIEAEINPVNIASERLLKKLGFKYEGTLRERYYFGGGYQTTAQYAKLETD